MSWRAELLRLALRLTNKRKRRRQMATATIRRRLKLVEAVVPGPPTGTQTAATNAAGVDAVRIAARRSLGDRHVLYFHGGGYAIGTAQLYRDFTWRISDAARAGVLYFDYRLAPEHPFPAAVEDAVTVYRWLANTVDPRRIAFVGDSAGGGLVLGTLYWLRDEGVDLPRAAVVVSPWTDLALTGPSLSANATADPMMAPARLVTIASDYLAGADPRNPYASPLFGDPTGLPPTLIQVGSDEILRDDAVRMAEKMQAARCDVVLEVWPRMPHAWHLYARVVPEGRLAIERIGAFLREKLRCLS